MEEKLLHYIWQNQCFTTSSLLTSQQVSLLVLSPGMYNAHAGPDFEHVKIILDNIIWHGNVEIHVYASQWLEHEHEKDLAYNNVILHVVWQEDKIILNQQGEKIPTLELKNYVDIRLLERYQHLMQQKKFVLCENLSATVPVVYQTSAIESGSIHKLSRKANDIHNLLQKNAGDWEQTTFQYLAFALGQPIHAEALLQLASRVPITTLKKYADDVFHLEALLFGLAGFLQEEPDDAYQQKLKHEFQFLKSKHTLQNQILPHHIWKFLRLRPASFPTIKIAQLAAILHQQPSLFSVLLETDEPKELQPIFCPSLSAYWQKHYRFGVQTQASIKPGDQSFQQIILNGAIPLLFAYGHYIKDENISDKALHWLQNVKPEINHITKKWKQIGWVAENAFDTQGLLELKKYWCDKKACLDCTVGHYLLK
ncbi:MAG: DUF2851 family protein [Chryseotalea sp.]